MDKKFEKADARASRDVYQIIIGVLVIAVILISLSLYHTREALINCIGIIS